MIGACEVFELPELPTAPSDVTSGVSIYEHANFLGASALITEDVRDLKNFHGPCKHQPDDPEEDPFYDWNDCISSIRVASGWRAVIYRDDNFRGQSLEVNADVGNLQLVAGRCDHDGLNDCITSIRVREP